MSQEGIHPVGAQWETLGHGRRMRASLSSQPLQKSSKDSRLQRIMIPKLSMEEEEEEVLLDAGAKAAGCAPSKHL